MMVETFPGSNQLQAHAGDVTEACSTLSAIVTQVDWHFILNLTIPALITIVGWFFAHWLTAIRERGTQRRTARVAALEKAFMRLARCSNTHMDSESAMELETFVAEIQLYGTPAQVELMERLGREVHGKSSGTASFDLLHENLRNQLREDLKLGRQHGRVWSLRIPRS